MTESITPMAMTSAGTRSQANSTTATARIERQIAISGVIVCGNMPSGGMRSRNRVNVHPVGNPAKLRFIGDRLNLHGSQDTRGFGMANDCTCRKYLALICKPLHPRCNVDGLPKVILPLI